MDRTRHISSAQGANSVQPAGFLLAMSPEWQVEQASANVGDFLGHSADQLIGRPASLVLPGDAIHALRNRLALLRGTDGMERLFSCQLADDRPLFDALIHLSDGLVVLEAEPSVGKNDGDIIGTVRAMSAPLDNAGGLDGLLTEGARQLRALTGYDRVMVIRFDRQFAGDVVAECSRGGIGKLIGEHFAATSFPDEERAAWQRSLLHVVSDIDAAPVPIGSETGSPPLDLSLSVLRFPSPAHIAHLQTIGAQAAMTMSITVGGKLWGVVACHHHLPRRPSVERRSMAELFVQMFAMRIEIAELRRSLVAPTSPPGSISAG